MMKTKTLFLILPALILAGCLNGSGFRERTAARWVGRPLAGFVAEYGKPQSGQTVSGGDTAYLWNSEEGAVDVPDYAVSRLYGDYSYKRYPGAGNINLMCEVRIAAGRDGVIKEFGIMRDTMGLRGDSRCREVFGGEKTGGK